MDAATRAEVETIITKRIGEFHDAMVRRGQITEITKGEPPISRQSSRYSQLACMPRGFQLDDPAPLEPCPLQMDSCEHASPPS
jgi:hypothetical protein